MYLWKLFQHQSLIVPNTYSPVLVPQTFTNAPVELIVVFREPAIKGMKWLGYGFNGSTAINEFGNFLSRQRGAEVREYVISIFKFRNARLRYYCHQLG